MSRRKIDTPLGSVKNRRDFAVRGRSGIAEADASLRSGFGAERPDVRQHGADLGLGKLTLPARHRPLALVDHLEELRVGARLHVRLVVEVARFGVQTLRGDSVPVAAPAVETTKPAEGGG